MSKRKLNEQEACEYFQQIIAGVEYMHTMGVAHRDMKPENLLITFTKEIKIVDFGLSNIYKKGTFLSTACGSPCYAAPEMLEGKKYRGLSVDIWSCGTVLYMMLTGKLPFEDDDNVNLYKKIITGQYALPEHLSRNAKDLLRKMLQTNPRKRITLNEIRSHPWFNIVPHIDNVHGGINVKTHVLPIDEDIVDKMEKYEYDKNEVKRNIIFNEHNNITTTYYLLLKKKGRQGIGSVSDCKSEQFKKYIQNESNLLVNYKGDLNEVIQDRVTSTTLIDNNDTNAECVTVNERSSSKPSRKYRNKSAQERNIIIKVSNYKYKQECLHKQMFTYFTQRLSRFNNDNAVMTSIRTPKLCNTRNVNNTSHNNQNNNNNNNNTFVYSHFHSFKTDDTLKRSIYSPIHRQHNNDKHCMTIQISNFRKQFPQCKLTKNMQHANIHKVSESRNNNNNNNIPGSTEYKHYNKTRFTTMLHSKPKSTSVESKMKHCFIKSKVHKKDVNLLSINELKDRKVCSASKERSRLKMNGHNCKRSNQLNKVNSVKNVWKDKHTKGKSNEIQSPMSIQGLFVKSVADMVDNITGVLADNKIKYTYDKKQLKFKCDKIQRNNDSLRFEIGISVIPQYTNSCYVKFHKLRGDTLDYIKVINLLHSSINEYQQYKYK